MQGSQVCGSDATKPFMNLASLLARAAQTTPDTPALALGYTVIATYAEHAEHSARLAGALTGIPELTPGDRVAIAMKNAPEYSEIMFGAWHAGLAAVPMNARLHPREFAYILENSGAKICFVSEDMAAGNISSLPVQPGTAICCQRNRLPLPMFTPTISPGCSIRRVRPGAPKARC